MASNRPFRPAALCQSGTWALCTALTYEAYDAAYENGDEVSCDGIDNNCSGQVDESFTLVQKNGVTVKGINQSCGVGKCAGGVTVCNAAKNGITCPSELNASNELCNGTELVMDRGHHAGQHIDLPDFLFERP